MVCIPLREKHPRTNILFLTASIAINENPNVEI